MKVKLACGHEVVVTEHTAELLKKGEVAVFCKECMLEGLRKRKINRVKE